MKLSLSLLFVLSLVGVKRALGAYNVGLGRGDVTGPAAEVGMMGYAKGGQNTKGIHIRQFSRCYIVEDVNSGTRVVFVTVDGAMMSQLVKMRVVEELEILYPGLYSEHNVVLSATHTHSGPAGYMQYLLFNVSNLGFIKQALDAMVTGITESIKRAHNSMQPGKVFLTSGRVEEEANINRSPSSYLANPEEERAKYESDTDRDMVQLNFFNAVDEPLGVLNWYAVHPTSMNNTNHFISGDNKGAASQMFEKAMNPDHLAGQTPFVAGFASTNLGDVSPNILGPRCIDTGLPCDTEHSTCDGRVQMCIASGPGEDMFESTKIIAERQFRKSYDLMTSPPVNQVELSGPVQFSHQWVDMSSYQVNLANGSTVSTCKPAMGYSFAAGTTDGPGEFDFTQGTITGNPFWDFISHLLKDPTPEQTICHAPKPILLDTGEYTLPFPWHPTSVDTQVLRIGQLMLLAVPGELTTMSGRRLRETVASAVTEVAGMDGAQVVIAGLSNTYTHYITTFEEYQKQRYEAASTIYGPHSLQAYQQQFEKLSLAMLAGEDLPAGPPPPDLEDVQLSFVPGVVMDNPHPGYNFGDCLEQPMDSVPGQSVSASYVSGHLRNDLMLESTFLTVERLGEDGEWVVVTTDADWDTKIEWIRTNVISGESNVQITWDIPEDVVEGTYRLGHQGYHKNLVRGVLPYSGWSESFEVGMEVVRGLERQKQVSTWNHWKELKSFIVGSLIM